MHCQIRPWCIRRLSFASLWTVRVGAERLLDMPRSPRATLDESACAAEGVVEEACAAVDGGVGTKSHAEATKPRRSIYFRTAARRSHCKLSSTTTRTSLKLARRSPAYLDFKMQRKALCGLHCLNHAIGWAFLQEEGMTQGLDVFSSAKKLELGDSKSTELKIVHQILHPRQYIRRPNRLQS